MKSDSIKEGIANLIKAQAAKDHHLERKALQALYFRTAPVGRGQESRPLHSRLFDRVIFGATDCWHWCGNRNAFGYGRMTFKGRAQVAHRLSWLAFNGAVPEGMSVLHRCDNPSCINPEHLWLGTYSDNLRDAWAKGRNKGRTGQKGNNQYTRAA